MIRLVIIEDDLLTSDYLIELLGRAPVSTQVKAVLRTVKGGIEFLSGSSDEIDLILSDIQLQDGLVFSVLEEVQLTCPVVFITSHNQYVSNAFEYGGIDYITKPVSEEKLYGALRKYSRLVTRMQAAARPVSEALFDYLGAKKTRILVKKGSTNLLLPLNDIMFFFTENMMVYVYDNSGNKYLVDK